MATTTTPTGLTRSDRVLFWFFALVAGGFGAATLLQIVNGLRYYAASAANGDTELSLINRTYSGEGYPTEGEPSIVFGHAPTTDLLVRGLGPDARALLAIGEGLTALVALVVSVGIAWLLALAINGTFAQTVYSRYSPYVRALAALCAAVFSAGFAAWTCSQNALSSSV